jgi:hypothetical protein
MGGVVRGNTLYTRIKRVEETSRRQRRMEASSKGGQDPEGGWMGGWVGGWVGGWMDGWMDGWEV